MQIFYSGSSAVRQTCFDALCIFAAPMDDGARRREAGDGANAPSPPGFVSFHSTPPPCALVSGGRSRRMTTAAAATNSCANVSSSVLHHCRTLHVWTERMEDTGRHVPKTRPLTQVEVEIQSVRPTQGRPLTFDLGHFCYPGN